MPLNGETISFAGTLGKRVTTRTKTDDTEREGKRDGTGKGQRETGNERGSNEEGTGSPPKVTEGRRGNGGKDRARGRPRRWGRRAVEETETGGGAGRVAFNSIS